MYITVILTCGCCCCVCAAGNVALLSLKTGQLLLVALKFEGSAASKMQVGWLFSAGVLQSWKYGHSAALAVCILQGEMLIQHCSAAHPDVCIEHMSLTALLTFSALHVLSTALLYPAGGRGWRRPRGQLCFHPHQQPALPR
jgi:hypothetical protein